MDRLIYGYEEGNPANEINETQRTELEQALQDAWKEKVKRYDLEVRIEVALKEIGNLLLMQQVASDDYRNQFLLGKLEFLQKTLKP
jgi:hypothetical protein